MWRVVAVGDVPQDGAQGAAPDVVAEHEDEADHRGDRHRRPSRPHPHHPLLDGRPAGEVVARRRDDDDARRRHHDDGTAVRDEPRRRQDA